jgi:hypothetical protein
MNKTEHREWRICVLGADLTWAQKVILLALETFADYPAGTNARPGVELLADMCGCDRHTVGEALDAGVEVGLIEQTARQVPKKKRAAVYRLLPQPVSTAATTAIEDTVSMAGSDVSMAAAAATTNPSTPIHLHQEKPSSSLRSDDGKDFPRSQARTATDEEKNRLSATEIHRQAQKIVSRYVDYRVRNNQNRSGFDRAVRDALTRGLDENKIIAAMAHPRAKTKPWFRCHLISFRRFSRQRAFRPIAHLSGPHLTRSLPRLFLHRSRPRSSAKAPVGGLKPPPARRLRRSRKLLHLLIQHQRPGTPSPTPAHVHKVFSQRSMWWFAATLRKSGGEGPHLHLLHSTISRSSTYKQNSLPRSWHT